MTRNGSFMRLSDAVQRDVRHTRDRARSLRRPIRPQRCEPMGCKFMTVARCDFAGYSNGLEEICLKFWQTE
jgi:hypothetical protein